MGLYNPITRKSDGVTVKLDLQEAEQAEVNAGAKKTLAPGDFLTQKIAYTASGFAEYLGFAVPGSSAASAVWLIKKLTYSGTSVTDIQFANGSLAFDQIWNDRVGLSYS